MLLVADPLPLTEAARTAGGGRLLFNDDKRSDGLGEVMLLAEDLCRISVLKLHLIC